MLELPARRLPADTASTAHGGADATPEEAGRTARSLGACALVAVAACGDDDGDSRLGGGPGGGRAPDGDAAPVGEGEGELNILAWPGYAEDG